VSNGVLKGLSETAANISILKSRKHHIS
jgi:hypothetical protein